MFIFIYIFISSALIKKVWRDILYICGIKMISWRKKNFAFAIGNKNFIRTGKNF